MKSTRILAIAATAVLASAFGSAAHAQAPAGTSPNIIWGTNAEGTVPNIIWGTNAEGTVPNIIWGTNIIWGGITEQNPNIIWGTRVAAPVVGNPLMFAIQNIIWGG